MPPSPPIQEVSAPWNFVGFFLRADLLDRGEGADRATFERDFSWIYGPRVLTTSGFINTNISSSRWFFLLFHIFFLFGQSNLFNREETDQNYSLSLYNSTCSSWLIYQRETIKILLLSLNLYKDNKSKSMISMMWDIKKKKKKELYFKNDNLIWQSSIRMKHNPSTI